ncbi:MAG TPA: hypothetical protein VK889_04525 [Solirubrobacterales bacterium]|nr:hypothetical protein [Solirubrobacterales bacterium]
MSRFRAFLLVAALAALATTFAACGGGSSDDPQEVIDNATVEGVESGNLDLSISIKADGKEGGNLDLSLAGPFQQEGKGKLPQLDLAVKADGAFGDESLNFDGGLTLLSDKAYVAYEGTEYEVDATTFGFVKAAIEDAQQKGESESSSADVTACQEAATGIEIGDFVDNLTDEGSVDVEGTSTTQVGGDLNVGGAIDAIVQLAEDPACSAQFEAAGSALPIDELKAAKSVLTEAIQEAQVEVYVGDDDIIRKASANLTIAPPEGADAEGVSALEVDFEMTLGGVNEPQEIEAPSGAKPLTQLFQKLDVNPIELLEAGSSAEGLEGLLEGGIGGSSGGSGGGGGGGNSALPSSEYLECLKDVKSAADLQKCEGLM